MLRLAIGLCLVPSPRLPNNERQVKYLPGPTRDKGPKGFTFERLSQIVTSLRISPSMDIAKANESLEAAERCYSEGMYNSSVSRAYYAMYQAAQTALEAAGFIRAEWIHGGLQASFANELTRRRKVYSAFLARDLNVVQELRHTADYRNNDVSKRQAMRALAKASEFVGQIRKELSDG